MFPKSPYGKDLITSYLEVVRPLKEGLRVLGASLKGILDPCPSLPLLPSALQ